MTTDPIADFLTRIRNAQMSKHAVVHAPNSKTKVRIAELLRDEGYIKDFSVESKDGKSTLTVQLKYDGSARPVIEGIKRVSKPGLRVYKAVSDLPDVRGGFGMAVVSTSHGIMTDQRARRENVGGEVLCYVW